MYVVRNKTEALWRIQYIYGTEAQCKSVIGGVILLIDLKELRPYWLQARDEIMSNAGNIIYIDTIFQDSSGNITVNRSLSGPSGKLSRYPIGSINYAFSHFNNITQVGII